jgi:hypothetical protein
LEGATVGKTIFSFVFIEKKFSRTSRPISIKLGTKHSWVKTNEIVQIKGQALFKGEIITKIG